MFLDVDHRAANTPVYLQSRESTQELSVQPPNPGLLKLSRPPNTNSVIQRHLHTHTHIHARTMHTHLCVCLTDCRCVCMHMCMYTCKHTRTHRLRYYRRGGIYQKKVNKSDLSIISWAYVSAAHPQKITQNPKK